MRILLGLFLLIVLNGCAAKKYYDSDLRQGEEPVTLVLRESGLLNLVSVDGVKFDGGFTDRKLLRPGVRNLEFKYVTKKDVIGPSLMRVYYTKYTGSCEFLMGRSYIVSIMDGRLVISDVGAMALPQQPILFGGPDYGKQMDMLASEGKPITCRYQESPLP